MDARYLKAMTVLPHQDKVCGRTLLAFCLRHRVCLEAINSPFLDPENRSFTPLDVVLAVRVMSTHDKTSMSKPLDIFEKYHLIRLSLNKKRFLRSIGTIIGCISTCCSYPKFWKKKEKKNHNLETIPGPLSCVATLTRNGISLEDAWTMPEGEAMWMSVAHAIYNGAKLDILSTEEEKELEQHEAKIEAYKNRMKEQN